MGNKFLYIIIALVIIGGAWMFLSDNDVDPDQQEQVDIASLGTESASEAQESEPVWDANKVEMAVEKLQENVYAYYSSEAAVKSAEGRSAATSGGFIVGENGVLMIDTMINKRLYDQVETLITSATDKPILYAINTSAHGDHSYGNMYVPEGTQIVQHENTKAYVENNFKADTEFMIQNFGSGRGIEEIVPITGDILVKSGEKITLDLGGRTVEIIDFGFAQTGGDLFIWDAQSKTLWTGNAIVAEKPALPWLLAGNLVGTLETFKQVRDFLPEDATIIPGHGVAITKDELQWHIDYLATIKTNVEKAIVDGLTLEETVAQVAMPEFTGYKLFGWVHAGLNVPAAYADLTKE